MNVAVLVWLLGPIILKFTIIVGVNRRSTDKRSKIDSGRSSQHVLYCLSVSFFLLCPFFLYIPQKKLSFNDKVWTIDFLWLVFSDLSFFIKYQSNQSINYIIQRVNTCWQYCWNGRYHRQFFEMVTPSILIVDTRRMSGSDDGWVSWHFLFL